MNFVAYCYFILSILDRVSLPQDRSEIDSDQWRWSFHDIFVHYMGNLTASNWISLTLFPFVATYGERFAILDKCIEKNKPYGRMHSEQDLLNVICSFQVNLIIVYHLTHTFIRIDHKLKRGDFSTKNYLYSEFRGSALTFTQLWRIRLSDHSRNYTNAGWEYLSPNADTVINGINY